MKPSFASEKTCLIGSSMFTRISETAKSPMAIPMKPTPSSKFMLS